MKSILVTGGTTFVSKYVADYFVNHDYEVYVLNRNTKPQVKGVQLITGDRHNLGDILKDMHFDIVLDITAYDAQDIIDLYNALGSFEKYIMISSSAVYPEYGVQPFLEDSEKNVNIFWGKYGTDKIDAENALLERVPDAYILRPPYLYGPMNNVYREAFVFDCAKTDRKFYLPKDGAMKLQFFHVRDLCKLMEVIIANEPSEHILNVGNSELISIKDWVTKCYACFDKVPSFVNVYDDIEQRNYFSFYNYEYCLDVKRQHKIYPNTISLEEGLKESAKWYLANEAEVNRKSYFDYIDANFA
ncbi:MAG: NAD-dependent epimerase/dehydratase family protein [Eubacteriales bacterium]|nr:NAD-dependent epimerase/dehydratase family protein [Eubacteriales bacterium]